MSVIVETVSLWNWEPGTQSTSPTWCLEHSFSSCSLLPYSVYFYCNHESEFTIEPWCSDTECRHLNQCLNHKAKWISLNATCLDYHFGTKHERGERLFQIKKLGTYILSWLNELKCWLTFSRLTSTAFWMMSSLSKAGRYRVGSYYNVL